MAAGSGSISSVNFYKNINSYSVRSRSRSPVISNGQGEPDNLKAYLEDSLDRVDGNRNLNLQNAVDELLRDSQDGMKTYNMDLSSTGKPYG